MRDEPPAQADDPEAALLQRLRLGEPAAFAELVRSQQRLVWHVVQRVVRNAEDSRELVQETFLRVHRALPQFRGDSRLSTWVARIAWTLAVRHAGTGRIQTVAAPEGNDESSDHSPWPPELLHAADPQDVQAEVAQAQLMARLRQAIDTLPPVQRVAITLHHLHDMPIPEIADVTGEPVGTVKSHLFRGRAVLKRALLGSAGTAPPGSSQAKPPSAGTTS
jgi:RNA polymerase sigma factor (sigma-70 family)